MAKVAESGFCGVPATIYKGLIHRAGIEQPEPAGIHRGRGGAGIRVLALVTEKAPRPRVPTTRVSSLLLL